MDADKKSDKSIVEKVPTRVIHKVKQAAQQKVAEAKKQADAVRRLDLKQLLPDVYESLLKAVGDDIRAQHDPTMPKKAITIPIPLPSDEDFKMQIHVGGDVKKPKVLLEFGAKF